MTLLPANEMGQRSIIRSIMSENNKELEILDGLTEKSRDLFIENLARVIEKWLDNMEIEKLSFYLYRIDVHEYKANKVIHSLKSNHDKSIELATMMVDRHLQKSDKKLN